MKRLLPFLIIASIAVGIVWGDENIRRQAALSRLVERADSGDAKALYDLAYLHDIGYDTIPVDSIRSSALYLKSAEKGYPPAMNFIGFRYYKGEIVNKDTDSAIFWIRKAADAGDITAAANLGYLYADSPEIEHNEDEAVKWLDIAAQAGVREAQFKLVELMGDQWKNLPPDSALNLGAIYYTGKAPIAAIPLLEQAASNGLPKALALLGDAYSKGLGVPYDHQKSIDYFYEAAVNDEPSAQFILAELLEFFPDVIPSQEVTQGEPVSSNPEYWYEKAALQNIVDAESAYRHLLSLP